MFSPKNNTPSVDTSTVSTPKKVDTSKKVWNATKKVWEWLDGNKTTIGMLCMLVAQAVPVTSTAYYILQAIGIVSGAVGISHKVVKQIKK